jgi:hypothetical protein
VDGEQRETATAAGNETWTGKGRERESRESARETRRQVKAYHVFVQAGPPPMANLISNEDEVKGAKSRAGAGVMD